MKKIVLSMVGVSLLGSTLFGAAVENRERQQSVKQLVGDVAQRDQKEISIVEELRHMFTDGKVTGQLRSMYIGYNEKNTQDNYATAIGGSLKYELAEFKGFSGAVAFVTTHDISYLSGDDAKHNEELSGADGSYTQLEEAYLSYRYKQVLLKAGRQTFDTPLADSDDIRMVPNSFEAYTALYEGENISAMVGHFDRWQGCDVGLDNKWVKTGKDGVNFVGMTYDGEILEANAWFYNFSNASEIDINNGADANGNNSYYVDFGGHYHINDAIHLHGVVQYLKQDELDQSGVAAEIYGVSAEFVVDGLSFNVAYNESARKARKHSFSGYGGGYLFTSLDAMILDEITEDRRAYAWVGGVSYEVDELNLFYAYGDFKGDADTAGEKAHIVEHNIGLEYAHNDELTIGAIYVIDDNKEESLSPDFNNDNFRIVAAYNF